MIKVLVLDIKANAAALSTFCAHSVTELQMIINKALMHMSPRHYKEPAKRTEHFNKSVLEFRTCS